MRAGLGFVVDGGIGRHGRHAEDPAERKDRPALGIAWIGGAKTAA